MRILYIIHQFFPEFSTGTERVTMNIARTQQRNGHSVHVLTCSVRGSSYWSHERQRLRHAVVNSVPISAVPRDALGDLADLGVHDRERASSIISRFLDQNTYDVVHVTHPMRMLDAVDMIRARSIPYIITLTDFFAACWRINLIRRDGVLCSGPAGGTACLTHCTGKVATPERLAQRQRRLAVTLSNAKYVLACSDFVAEFFRREFPGLQIRVLGHGIDLPRYVHRAPDRAQTPIVFGYIGTLSKAKGVHVLIEAFKRAAVENARLQIVGSSYGDDKYLTHLRGLCTPAIKIREAVDHNDIPDTLAQFDVMCLPSLVPETFSLALHEGFAAGLPALVSNIGWPPRVIDNASCGRAVPAGDVEAWSAAITEVTRAPDILQQWRNNISFPSRIEEEGFFYNQFYRQAASGGAITPTNWDHIESASQVSIATSM